MDQNSPDIRIPEENNEIVLNSPVSAEGGNVDDEELRRFEAETKAQEKKEKQLESLDAAMRHYADLARDNKIESINKYRKKATAEEVQQVIKRFAVKAGIGAGIGTIFGGPVGTLAGVAGAVGSEAGIGLAKLIRFAKNKLHKKTGESDEMVRQELEEEYNERYRKLGQIALAWEKAQELQPGEKIIYEGQEYTADEIRLKFLEQASAMSDISEKEKEYQALNKKWNTIERILSVAGGILAGGAVTEAMKATLTQRVSEAGVNIKGQGIGDIAKYGSDQLKHMQQLGHHVHSLNDGTIAFDYHPNEITEIRNAISNAPDWLKNSFNSELIKSGMHEAGNIAGQFNSIVNKVVSERITEILAATGLTAFVVDTIDRFRSGRKKDYLEELATNNNVEESASSDSEDTDKLPETEKSEEEIEDMKIIDQIKGIEPKTPVVFEKGGQWIVQKRGLTARAFRGQDDTAGYNLALTDENDYFVEKVVRLSAAVKKPYYVEIKVQNKKNKDYKYSVLINLDKITSDMAPIGVGNWDKIKNDYIQSMKESAENESKTVPEDETEHEVLEQIKKIDCVEYKGKFWEARKDDNPKLNVDSLKEEYERKINEQIYAGNLTFHFQTPVQDQEEKLSEYNKKRLVAFEEIIRDQGYDLGEFSLTGNNGKIYQFAAEMKKTGMAKKAGSSKEEKLIEQLSNLEDEKLAEEFWANKRSDLPAETVTQWEKDFKQKLEDAAKVGTFRFPYTPPNLSKEDERLLAVYRKLAKDNNILFGDLITHGDRFLVFDIKKIEKVEDAKNIETLTLEKEGKKFELKKGMVLDNGPVKLEIKSMELQKNGEYKIIMEVNGIESEVVNTLEEFTKLFSDPDYEEYWK